jgi:putative FmdB family regulatory protein
MPIYDYHCDHCGHAFSAVQSYKDEALGACPNCAKRPRRLVTAPAIVFKGSGWYKTDSRAPSTASTSTTDKDGGKSEGKTETSERKSEGKAETKSESKAESKSEGKAESKPDKAAAKSSES